MTEPKTCCEICSRIIGEEEQYCEISDCPWRDNAPLDENFMHCTHCGETVEKCNCNYDTITA